MQDPIIVGSALAWLTHLLLKGRSLWPKTQGPDEQYAEEIAMVLLKDPKVRQAVAQKDSVAVEKILQDLMLDVSPEQRDKLSRAGVQLAPSLRQQVLDRLAHFRSVGAVT